ncbi:MAG TPA: 3-oxoacyl-ACP reductase family protein [Candidatus Binataceae bacterium]|nr:3-oxoacyl-ACP reductase family protein [Candidatus Binataceae bacterium]
MLGDSGLAGKSVIVSGGSRGIGRAIVEAFAAERAHVTFLYREDRASALAVVESARTQNLEVTAEQIDVRDAPACAELVDKVLERFGWIDVLVNNAGIVRDNLLPMLEDDDINAVLQTNVGGTFNLTRAALPPMISRRAGKIINISSVAARKGGRGQTNYAASKGAINSLTRALAVELAPRGINVNAVAPGVIETDMSARVVSQAQDEVMSRILLRRLGTPADVAAAVVFLASRFADYITGEILHVDGGFKME